MRIAVMAAGAVGGYFGARLAAAGHEVHFVARGANLAAMRREGLRVASVLGDLHLPAPLATDDPASIGPVDVVLFAVKLWDTEAAGRQARPLLGPQTRLIPLMNGIDGPELLAPILGADRVAPGSAYIAAVLSAPGTVSHTSGFARLVFGRRDGQPDATLSAFAEAAQAAGIDVTLSDAIDRERWQKFVFLAGLSGATASTRLPLGPLLADPDTRALFRGLMEETAAVGRARGVDLPEDLVEDRMRFAEGSPPGFKASMLHDLERGNRLELDWLAGTVVRLGRELGVPVPWNTAVHAILKPYRLGRPDGA